METCSVTKLLQAAIIRYNVTGCYATIGCSQAYEPGVEGREVQPPKSGKTIIFRTNAKIFGQKPAAKKCFKKLFCFYRAMLAQSAVMRQ